jgi:hypothetical protein
MPGKREHSHEQRPTTYAIHFGRPRDDEVRPGSVAAMWLFFL